MSMKVKYILKRINLSILLVLVTGVFSCKKYLDLKPQSSFDESYVFSTVTTATSAVMGVYGHLAGQEGYGSRLSTMYTVDQDESMSYSNTSAGGGDGGQKSLARYNATSENAILLPPYNQLYAGIEGANICIKNIPKMDAYTNGSATDQAALKRLYGEVLTLRAQFFFELIRNWGDVVAPFIPSIDQPDLTMPQTNRDEIYDHILADLKTAEDLVPWRKEVGGAANERITKGAVKAIRAKIALFSGGYSLRSSHTMERRANYLDYYKIARDECDEIIKSGQHALNPTFESIFKTYMDAHLMEPNGEILFEVAMAGGLAATDSRLTTTGPTVGVNANGACRMLPTYYYAFDPLDTRKDVTVTDYSINSSNFKTAHPTATIGVIYAGKFRQDWVTNPTIDPKVATLLAGINWPVIRYSDVLLMFAEADNELNGGATPEAVAAFEAVRKRGFKGNETKIGLTPTDKDGFFKAIINERWLEFGGEGIRKYDLIRWNLLGTKIAEAKANLLKIVNKQAPYQNLPTIRYYKTSSTTMVWYNSMYTPEPVLSTTPAGYTKVNWTAGLSLAYINTVADSFTPNRAELLPFPLAAINANPKIIQNYGY